MGGVLEPQEGDLLLSRTSVCYSADGTFIPSDIARIIDAANERGIMSRDHYDLPSWNRVGMVVVSGNSEEGRGLSLLEADARGIRMTPLKERLGELEASGTAMAVRTVRAVDREKGDAALTERQRARLSSIKDIAASSPSWHLPLDADTNLQSKAIGAFCGRVLAAALGSPRYVLSTLSSNESGEISLTKLLGPLRGEGSLTKLKPWVDDAFDIDAGLSAMFMQIVLADMGLIASIETRRVAEQKPVMPIAFEFARKKKAIGMIDHDLGEARLRYKREVVVRAEGGWGSNLRLTASN